MIPIGFCGTMGTCGATGLVPSSDGELAHRVAVFFEDRAHKLEPDAELLRIGAERRVDEEHVVTALAVGERPVDERGRREPEAAREQVAAHAPDWASFRYLAGRYLRAYGVGTPEALEEFIKGVPEMLSETVQHVGWDHIQAFLDRSHSDTLQAIKDYLS